MNSSGSKTTCVVPSRQRFFPMLTLGEKRLEVSGECGVEQRLLGATWYVAIALLCVSPEAGARWLGP